MKTKEGGLVHAMILEKKGLSWRRLQELKRRWSREGEEFCKYLRVPKLNSAVALKNLDPKDFGHKKGLSTKNAQLEPNEPKVSLILGKEVPGKTLKDTVCSCKFKDCNSLMVEVILKNIESVGEGEHLKKVRNTGQNWKWGSVIQME